MANDANGVSWTISEPANTDPRNEGAQEIRGLRTGVGLRMLREHTDFAGSSVGGEHIAGSAVSYRQSGAPTNRPDGSTSLTSADDGRLWVDSDDERLYSYVDPNWVLVAPTTVNADMQPNEVFAAFISASGWENDTGFLVLLTVSYTKTIIPGNARQWEVQDVANTYRIVAQSSWASGDAAEHLQASFFVPDGNTVRPFNGVAVTQVTGTARYSHILFT